MVRFNNYAIDSYDDNDRVTLPSFRIFKTKSSSTTNLFNLTKQVTFSLLSKEGITIFLLDKNEKTEFCYFF